MCSAAVARELGIPTERWVFVHAGARAQDEWFVSERREIHRSPAIAACGRALYEHAGVGPDDLGPIDLYSCFPAAVRAGRRGARPAARRPRAAAHLHRRAHVLRRAGQQLRDARDRRRGAAAARGAGRRARAGERARLVRDQARAGPVRQPTAGAALRGARARAEGGPARGGRAGGGRRRRSRPSPSCTTATARRPTGSSSRCSTTAGAGWRGTDDADLMAAMAEDGFLGARVRLSAERTFALC